VAVKDGRARGNAGMHQEAMAAAAVAIDRPDVTDPALDWLFEPDPGKPPYGGDIPTILVERLCREGFSDEAALGYSSIPAKAFLAVAELLRRRPQYTKHDLYRDYPKFRNCFSMCRTVRVIDRYSPNHGDGDKCMNFGTTGLTMPVAMELQGYRVYGGREIAREVWFSNGKKLEGLKLDVYDPEPEEILTRLKADLADDPGPLESYNSGGYGLAVLQAAQREAGRALMLYYGRMEGHGHEDRLALGLVAKDVVMMPDMGYPLYTGSWPARVGWDSHTISHNTCMVDDNGFDRASWSGKTRLFGEAGPVRVVDVDGGRVYGNVDVFRRCVVMVDVDATDSYALDLFWVSGGDTHRLIQNGGGPEVTTGGLELTAQEKGTYAGENVEFGEFYDGESGWAYDGSGFMYLNRVERAKPRGDFWVDWRIVEPRRTMPPEWEAHLRVHNLTPVDEAALCDGFPPAYKGNPPVLRYLLRTRFGKDLSTQFVSVIEPYGKTPIIQTARLLKSEPTNAGYLCAVEVTLADGRRDVLLVTQDGGKVEAGGVALDGRVGFARFSGERAVAAALIEGAKLQAGDRTLELPVGAITGKLLGWDDSDPAQTVLKLDGEPTGTDVVGRTIIIDNRERSDASYRVESLPGPRDVSIGCNSLAERFVDRSDYAKGIVYNVAPGDGFRIPLTAAWEEDRR